MPQVEHQRPIRLSDIVGQEYSREEEEDTSSCLSSLEYFLLSLVGSRTTKGSARSSDRSAGEGFQRQQHSNSGPKAEDTKRRTFKEGHTAAGLAQTQVTATDLQKPKRALTRPQGLVEMAWMQSSKTINPSLSQYKKTEGAVSKHTVQVSRTSPHHTSIHLAHTPSNNYREKDRHATHMTTFGDFLESPQQRPSSTRPPLPKAALASPKRPVTTPRSTHPSTPKVQYTIAGVMKSNAVPASNHLDLLQGTQMLSIEPQECNICGIPNSPCTRYGKKGLWLCTACRSPTSAVEFPPRIDSRVGDSPRQPSSAVQAEAGMYRSEDIDETCPYCHTCLAATEREGFVFCSWCCKQLPGRSGPILSPAQPSSQRVRSHESEMTRKAEAEWQSFDSQPDADAESFDLYARQSVAESLYYGRRATGNVKPIPPLKDSVYLSKQSFPKLQGFHIPQISSPSPPLVPPKPTSRKARPQTNDLPDRDSFYPDTTILPSNSPHFSIPQVPALPANVRHLSGRRSISTAPPSPGWRNLAKEFPYPPPPIPDDRVRRPRRSSSVYPDCPAPRIHTPDWQTWNKHRRNTSFYDYWEAILG